MNNGLALVIGNANYLKKNFSLINTINDAKDVSKKLLTLGFTVINRNDCTTAEFSKYLQEFAEELKDYRVAMFYYAGHGLQIEGRNYLSGTDTNFHDAPSAKCTSVCLDEIMERMQNAGPEIKILVLDACRDSPLPAMRGISYTGLAPIHAPKGTIIAFSTSPGEKAKDSGAGRNSIYTGAFLRHIDDPNIPIEEFFKRVRTSVFTHSNGQQTSWEHTSLIGDYYFNSGQLIHSKKLPYRKEHIADGEFVSSGSEFDEMIRGMRSHDWYSQGPALAEFSRSPVDSFDKSQLFLAGRNLVQMAEGHERQSMRIMNRLNNFLVDYIKEEENHVLNGMLFEIYFDSKGQLRQKKLKNKFINEIFQLRKNKKYQKSFDFICRLLWPFKEHVLYMPTAPPKSVAIDIAVEHYVDQGYGRKQKVWKIISIKNNNVELLHDQSAHLNSIKKKDIANVLATALSAPPDQVTITWNEPLSENAVVGYPWDFKLSRFPPPELKDLE